MAPRKLNRTKNATEDAFGCPHCGKSLRSEALFLKHMCSAKKRYLERDERHVKYGFFVFKKFYDIAYKGTRTVTEEQFRKSPYYSAFVRFANHLIDLNAVNPGMFIDFVIKSGIPVDRWCDNSVYEVYLRELNKRESPDAALERNFTLMQKWAAETGEDWTNFFRHIPPTQAVFWIRSGRISPWVLYTAPSAKDLFSRMSKEQFSLIQDAVDPKFWQVKLADNLEEVAAITAILQEAGL